MVDFGKYGTASREECLDDLWEIINYIGDDVVSGCFDYDELELKGIRIHDIANRLKELKDDIGV